MIDYKNIRSEIKLILVIIHFFSEYWIAMYRLSMKTIFDKNYRKLIGWISSERRYQKISQSQMNEKLGIKNRNFFSKVENFERRLDLNEYVNICLLLGLDPKEGIDMLVKEKNKLNDVYLGKSE